ncbi:MAG: DUF488 domain-containing protein [Thermodesulfobacteriota bacterium]
MDLSLEKTALTFVCLANSRKRRGRCIAGKIYEDGAPGPWVRPVGASAAQGLRESECRLTDYSTPDLLDILEIPVSGPSPLAHQKENHRLDIRRTWQRRGKLPPDRISQLLDHPESLWANDHHSASGLNNRVPAGEADGTSLYLIFVDSLTLEVGTKKLRHADDKRVVFGLFQYGKTVYRLAVTDPAVEEEYLAKPDGEYGIPECALCVSLSDEFEGYYYKLIASVIRDGGATQAPEKISDLREAAPGGQAASPALPAPPSPSPHARMPGAGAASHPGIIYTIGYSVLSLSGFLALLEEVGVTAVADVRSQPWSQRFPDFSRETLRLRLEQAGIAYVFLGDGLGARSNNPACYKNGKISFPLVAREEKFRKSIERLLAGAAKFRIAALCAEKDPLLCHRAILVARALHEMGVPVRHIHADGVLETHADLESRMLRKLKMSECDLFSNREENLALAYERMGERIAYEEESPGEGGEAPSP